MISGVTFADGGKVDIQVGQIFLQPLLPGTVDNFQVRQAGARAGRVDLRLIRRFHRLFIRAEAPEINERPDGNIHRVVGFCANAQRFGNDIGHRLIDRPGRRGAGVVKAHQRGVVLPGREEPVVGVEARLDFLTQFACARCINVRQADAPRRPHRFAFQHQRLRGVVTTGNHQGSSQQQGS